MLFVKQLNTQLNILVTYVSFLINDISLNMLSQTNFIEKYYIRSEYI